MDHTDKLNLTKMIDANNVEDCTKEIREKKHSDLIRKDVTCLLSLKQKYSRLAQSNPNQFDAMCVSQCSFLFNNYMDIFKCNFLLLCSNHSMYITLYAQRGVLL